MMQLDLRCRSRDKADCSFDTCQTSNDGLHRQGSGCVTRLTCTEIHQE